MRNAVIEALYQEALSNKDVFFLTGDLQHVREPEFRVLGDQYQNAGMAEQHLTSLAAGLALSGKKVFTFSIIPFITLRCIEQIKVDVCSHKADVTVIGGGAGVTYGTCGPTHLAIEDIAMMRALPSMKVICPSGPSSAVSLFKQIVQVGGPAYLRLNKRGESDLYSGDPVLGKGFIVRQGTDVCVIATGTILSEALGAAELLAASGVSVQVVDMHTIKPLDTDLVSSCAQSFPLTVTLEEHSTIGGLGGAVAEVYAETPGRGRLVRMGIADAWPSVVGSQAFLREALGLSAPAVAARITEALSELR
jgi:transketolase